MINFCRYPCQFYALVVLILFSRLYGLFSLSNRRWIPRNKAISLAMSSGREIGPTFELKMYKPLKKMQRDQASNEILQSFSYLPYRNNTELSQIIEAIANGGAYQAVESFDRIATNKSIKTLGLSPRLCDTLLCKLGDRGELVAASSLLKAFQRIGFKPTVFTYTALISRAGKWGQLQLAREYYDQMQRDRITPDIPLYNGFLNALAKAGLVNESFEVLNTILSRGLKPTIITMNTIIGACAQNGDLARALSLYSSLQSNYSLRPDAHTFTSLAQTFIRCNDLSRALWVLDAMKEHNVSPGIPIFTLLVDAFGAAGNLSKAFDLLQEMRLQGLRPSIVTISSLISTLGRTGQLALAFDLYRSLLPPLAPTVQANVVTCTSLLHHCFKHHAHDRAWQILQDMKDYQIKVTAATICVLGRGLLWQPQRLVEALQLLGLVPISPDGSPDRPSAPLRTSLSSLSMAMDELTRRGEPVDLAAFNIMLGICAQCGDLQEALSILDRMRKRSLHPDVISYTSLLKTCSRTSGDRGIALAKAEELFSAMQHAPYPVAPNRNTLRYLLKVHQAAKSPDIERVFSLFVLAKDRELCDHEIADLVASMLVTRGDPRRGVVMEWKRNHP